MLGFVQNWRMQFFGGSEISPSPPAPTASGNNAHMIYVFNRNGVCLLYREWNRPLHTLNQQQDHKLMFGLLFSLKSLTAKMDPTRYINMLQLLSSMDDYKLELVKVCSLESSYKFSDNFLAFVLTEKGNRVIILACMQVIFLGYEK